MSETHSIAAPRERKPKPGDNARRLLLARNNGILSTVSQKLGGYPFGSLAPFCLDRQGRPVVLISTIAEHTRNLKGDSRSSLIVAERMTGDVQAGGRVTLVGDFHPTPDDDDDIAERYYRFFPTARDYHKTHDFSFWRMTVGKVRYIGGFGEIHWLEPENVLTPNPFNAEQESSMVDHMNEDHVDAMRRYLEHASVPVEGGAVPTMAGVDAEGIHLLLGDDIHRIPFDQPVTSPPMVRQALVAMSKRARG